VCTWWKLSAGIHLCHPLWKWRQEDMKGGALGLWPTDARDSSKPQDSRWAPCTSVFT
jgi:hypothetical protein